MRISDVVTLPKRTRLPKDPMSREIALDNHSNFQADKEMTKASRIMERNFVRKGDPS